jgi:two-component system response regulator RstA
MLEMAQSALKTRILLVEDDLKLAALVKEYLEQNDFEVMVEPRGDRANQAIVDLQPDLVLLDIMLPGTDGITVCRDARPAYTGPIVMLTARDEDLDEVVGLEVGADDYLRKPVRPRVLLARIRTQLRRNGKEHGAERRVDIGDLVIDASQRTATKAGRAIELTSAEFDLLWLLAKHRGEPMSRDSIYRELRGIEHDGIDRSIDLRISRLRTKLGDKRASLIKSVRGVGYQLVVPA